MNKYINPEMDVKAFAVEDVITTSGITGVETNLPAGEEIGYGGGSGGASSPDPTSQPANPGAR